MAKRINVKLIMELSAGGLTQNEIASSRHFSKTSVNLVLKTARELNVSAADLREVSPEEAYRLFFPEKLSADQIYELPDYGYVHEELKKVGVTLKLLWEEYREKCLAKGNIPVGKTKFCDDYNKYCGYTGAVKPPVRRTRNRESGHKETDIYRRHSAYTGALKAPVRKKEITVLDI